MEKIFIRNRKKQKLAVVIKKQENAQGLAFILHGLGGYKEQPHIQTFSAAFKEKGFSTVLFDTTNSFGESAGDYEKATLTNYYEDLEDVISWAGDKAWYEEPFVLVGHSLGGISVILYAEKHPHKVLALAPISTVVSGKLSLEAHKRYKSELFKQWQETGWKVWESSTQPGYIKRLPWSHMEDRLKYDILPEVGKLTMPVLLIVGENDTSTPSDHIQKLHEVLSGPKQFCIIKGGPHTFRENAHLDQIKKLFLAWFDTF